LLCSINPINILCISSCFLCFPINPCCFIWAIQHLSTLPNLFQWLQLFRQEESLATWNKYYIPGVEFTQISSDILLNGFMTAEQKIMNISVSRALNILQKVTTREGLRGYK
jgi:hypothetical protein